jgi:hypothetical protein
MPNLLAAFKVTPDQYGNLPPKETVNARIIALALFGACAAILFGYDLGKFSLKLKSSYILNRHAGFIGGVVSLPAYLKDFDLNHAAPAKVTAFSSNVVSVFQVSPVTIQQESKNSLLLS